ncbi:hypothetical protein TPAU25S_03481 [Tsukamurella paurometabola]|uniref:DUF3592 domain-containing protein n=1 Tax=Tsukamurella paurometabola (strain ATCC 8368 / DSM 20162 / CCUG 35730 / CIP 100753 / JCM 10117 / KCTC 9821 / NBRC 16120 / NCIMB 702349 / NCTC 13040) TaxID=521096 RepID=D5UQ37_TSUPD|nr:DUF3592 domain-containing protein [Tsukamurella paurometabola]ADG76805.1 hypothetical protein Tpau_0151 [Tsukamurella paurometabola DSM 20162]SUP41710.1 Protein of uncharacterised function (DUF3592) [Tsukamurella paurometabola]
MSEPEFDRERRAAARSVRESHLMVRLFIALGVLTIAAGCYFTVVDTMFLASASTAEGRVVDYEESASPKENGRTEYSYQRIVGYTVDGVDYRKRESGASSSEPAIGDAVTVYYDPDDPQHAMIDAFMRKWLGPLAIIFGVLWTALFAAIQRWTRRKQGERERTAFHGARIPLTVTDLRDSEWRDDDGNTRRAVVATMTGTDSGTGEARVFTRSYEGRWRHRRAPALGAPYVAFVDDSGAIIIPA